MLDEARVRDILRVLCRVAVPRGQLVLYKLAVLNGDAGFKSNEVGAAVHYDGAQFRGLMAAYATRVNRTPRETYPTKKPGVDLMFVQTWLGNEYHYRPRPELLAAIERLPGLAVHLSRPMEEIVAGGSHAAPLPADVSPEPPRAAPPPAAAQAPVVPFHELLRRLDAEGLYFPNFSIRWPSRMLAVGQAGSNLGRIEDDRGARKTPLVGAGARQGGHDGAGCGLPGFKQLETLTDGLSRGMRDRLGNRRRFSDTTVRSFLVHACMPSLLDALHRKKRNALRKKQLDPVGLPGNITAFDGRRQ